MRFVLRRLGFFVLTLWIALTAELPAAAADAGQPGAWR